jgi:hypothetical protein
MSRFGQTLFGGGGFIRWTLSPLLLIFAVFMPLLIEDWTPSGVVLMAGMELACLCLLAGFWLPRRLSVWAFRTLAALVFLAYAAYLVHEFFIRDAPLSRSGPGASPMGALAGFIVIGIPSFWFALKGRFTLRPEPSGEELLAEHEALVERLLQPDWAFYERYLQRPVPAALRELYSDHALLMGDVEWPKEMDLSRFEPLDEHSLLNTRERLGFDILPLAYGGCGDPIYLRPGPTESDTVYITYHDGDDTEVFAESMAAMLKRLRRSSRAA